VLVLTFNRPDTTRKVLETVLAAQPAAVYLFSDGPRSAEPADAPLVAETRNLMDSMLAQHPRVYRRYMEDNQGLFRGVSGALDWFFSEVEEGIILEDDCVPHPDFFGYCDELLEKYRDDERVWCISGDNSLDLPVSGGASYGFIRDPLIWGWATWRRAWSHFDRDFSHWSEIRGTKREKELYPDRVERKIRRGVFDRYARGIDAWAFKWKMTLQYHGGLAAVPAVNLVSNIGWNRPDATHTKGDSLKAARPTFPILPLTHPAVVEIDRAAQHEFVESRGLGVKKHRWSYKVSKTVGRLRRSIGKALGR
jgi:hypothetical protein